MNRLFPTIALLLALAGPASAQVSPLGALDTVATRVIDKVAPSVVEIEVERTAAVPRRLTAQELASMGLGNNYDPRYFTRPEGPCSGVAVGPHLVATSIWNLDGDGAVTVITADGERRAAKRLGRDENLDVALLEVEGPELTQLPVAPDAPAVGRFVFLVARTPAGAFATEGIVSALGRYRGDSFAHSARTNYQNVGGALVDLDGRLVGLSVRHTDRSRQGQSSGVGFAAPVQALVAQLPGLARGENVARRKTPFLGISGDPESVGDKGGVRVRQVIAGTAAQKAGLQAGDIITIFNNVELRDFLHLREEIEKLSIGSEIVITVKRGEQELDITVKLGERQLEDDK